MRTSSAKAKGRRACQEVRDLLLKLGAPYGLQEDDIRVTSSGVCGEDLQLSPRAREIFDFCFECKNQEKIQIWAACHQAESHAGDSGRIPLLVFRRNRDKLRVALDFEKFIGLVFNAKKLS